MNNRNPNIRTLKLLHTFCPSYFPMLAARCFFDKLSPYFNLYLSAEIVNEIAGALNTERLFLLVLITIVGNFTIAIISGFLNRLFDHCNTLLSQKEAAFYNKKTLSLDYIDLENTEVRQLRRKITESAMIDNHGRQLLLLAFEELVDITIGVVLALILGFEMFLLIFTSGFRWSLIIYTIIIITLIVFNIWYSFKAEDKIGDISRQVSQTMIEENRIDEAVDCYNMGKDVRLYRQDKIIMKLKNYAFSLHKKTFRIMASKRYLINIPLTITQLLLQAITYIFICTYVFLGAFGVGSIIKYVGFIDCYS